MKKILLASTILVGTAGFAAADNANFTFSGSAYFGVGYNTVTTVFSPEITSSFTVGMSTMTDMGVEAGASIKVTANGVSFNDDHTSATFGALATTTFSVGDSSVYLSGDFGKLEVIYDQDGSGAGVPATDWDVNFKYSNTFGDFGIEAYYVVAIDGAAGTNGDAGAKGTYTMGDYSVYAKIDWDASAANWLAGFGGSATFSGATISADAQYDNATADWDWKAAASYTTGAFTVGAFAEDDGVDDRIDFGVNGSYAMGGGVSVDAAYIFDQDTAFGLAKLGVSMAF